MGEVEEDQTSSATITERHFFFKVARPPVLAEWLEDIREDFYVKELKGKADIFTFWNRIPGRPRTFVSRKGEIFWMTDNIAAIPLVTYDYWVKNQIGKKSRNMLRRAQKENVETNVCSVDDDLIRNIEQIYSHSPIRQGVPFTHYGKKFDQISREIGMTRKYPQNYIGAFHQGKMIGFIHLLFSKETAVISQIMSMQKYWDKAPNNALIARAVDLACCRGVRYLVYTKMHSRKETSRDSLRNFKKRNGFQEMPVVRYYIPLSPKGKLILFLRLHDGLQELLPQHLKDLMYSKSSIIVNFRLSLVRNFRRLTSFIGGNI